MTATLARAARLASAISLFGLAGCDLDVGDPSTPKSMIGAAPISQNVKTGAGAKISVFILNQYGEPLTAVPVSFAVASGTGTLDVTTVNTATTGLAEATFTATKAGTAVVNVSVAGLRALSFTVIASD
jgi:hypothetical protein